MKSFKIIVITSLLGFCLFSHESMDYFLTNRRLYSKNFKTKNENICSKSNKSYLKDGTGDFDTKYNDSSPFEDKSKLNHGSKNLIVGFKMDDIEELFIDYIFTSQFSANRIDVINDKLALFENVTSCKLTDLIHPKIEKNKYLWLDATNFKLKRYKDNSIKSKTIFNSKFKSSNKYFKFYKKYMKAKSSSNSIECNQLKQKVFNDAFKTEATFNHTNPFRLASYYKDNMVLQREPYSSIIWGYTNTNSSVSTILMGKLFTTSAVKVSWSDFYIWTLQLGPIPASDIPINIELIEIRLDGISSIIIKNVLFGDVWICSGQSNMQLSLLGVFNGTEEADNGAAFDKIRIMTASLRSSETPVYDLISIDQNWSVPSFISLGNGKWSYFSATCWYFGKSLYQNLNVPIGLIVTSWGGTNIEKWSTSKVIDDCGAAKDPSDSTLWNAMINPFLKLTIFGAVWYQGEANANYNRDFYNCTFPGMINDWRENWYRSTNQSTNPNFPFGFVQIANFNTETQSVGDYPILRFHQTADYGYVPNAKLNNVFMATAVDLVDNYQDPIHPRYKEDVGKRLSLGALNLAYKKSIEYYSPRVKKIMYTNSVATISFVSKLRPVSFNVINKNGFEVCCNNDQCPINDVLLWTQISDFSVKQNHIIFSLPLSCEKLKIVRYAWRQKPCEFKQCALYSSHSNLPVIPFWYQFD